ncbi:Cysteine/O-acetylserine efflux protein [Pigmentiphaga humi]|uniref:Cysteine/O-acetylserine efflux protein n=1 Tax=Pigmentiphaga humi TaxID=2478468 RepID=A0A3P4B7X7_9BURK|nr:LysE family translocator [Pigmentiphaga humi]VCU72419.1 Cysteine/O-acetylserine efflux protein [Pigmentiphaga humi]
MQQTAFAALIVYAFVMSITPGPNNVMLMSSGLIFGLRRTWPHLLGILAGVLLQIWSTGAGLGALFALEPRLQVALKIVGSLYLLGLATRLWRAAELEESHAGRPIGFTQALAFQFVNPKAWLMSVTVASTFLPPGDGYALRLLTVSLVFAAVGLPCIVVWAAFGAGLRPWLRDRTIARRINRAMALLAALTVLLFWM